MQITDRASSSPVISPDGKLIASVYWGQQQNAPAKIALFAFDGNQPEKVLEVPFSSWGSLRWTSDGGSLSYAAHDGGISSIWIQPIDGGPPKQLTSLKAEQVFWFNWSRDSKQLAVARGSVTSDAVLISNFK